MEKIITNILGLNASDRYNVFTEKLLSLELYPWEVTLIAVIAIALAVLVYWYLLSRRNGTYVRILGKLTNRANFAFAPITWPFRWAFFFIMLALPAVFALVVTVYAGLGIHYLITLL